MRRARRLAIAAAAEVMAGDQAGRDTTEWVEQMVRGVVNLCADVADRWVHDDANQERPIGEMVAAIRAIADEDVADALDDARPKR